MDMIVVQFKIGRDGEKSDDNSAPEKLHAHYKNIKRNVSRSALVKNTRNFIIQEESRKFKTDRLLD